MYKVYADGHLLYATNIENLKLVNPKATLEVNKTGSFTFTMYSNHPYYSLIQRLKTIIEVWQGDYLLFKGRVLNDELGFHNEKKIECEGELAFLIDSIQRPYNYKGSIAGFLEMLINNHNTHHNYKFALGNVTVTDPNDNIVRSSSECANTWDVINDKLIKVLGGYITTRHEEDITYIDYLEDFTLISPQKIEFAKNLIDMKRIRKGEDISTVLVPMGANLKDEEGNDTEERLTIKEVNNGLDYIFDEDAVAKYGWIETTHTWDDVTVASNLLSKAKEYLAELVKESETIDLSAADLATINKDITSFHIGTYVKVTSNPHSVNQNFLVSKLSIDLLRPESNKLTLGGIIESFTAKTASIQVVKGEKGEKGEKGDKGEQGVAGNAGADGKTPYFHIKYSANANGNPMTETPSTYIGTYVDYTEADSTDYTKYTWARLQGAQGAKGDQGIAGTNGADGKTSYLHVAYATSADGSTGFSVSDSTNKTYIGQYTDFTSADSTDYTKYKWTKIKGETGATGAAGNGISTITEYYQVSTSNSTAPSTWQTTVPTLTATNKYLWNYEKFTYTNGGSYETKKRVIGTYGDTGEKGATGSTGATGNGISTITNYYLASASSSGVTTSTSGWTTTIQTITTSKKYLWNYEIITYTSGSTTTTTPVIIGVYGNTGATGATGAAGKDAAIQSATAPTDTSYMWLDTSLTPPILKRYNTETSAWEVVNDYTSQINLVEQNLSATIEKTPSEILATVSESYTLKDDTEKLVSEVSTELSITKSSIEATFTTYSADLQALQNNTDAEFEEIKKYIRFDNGTIKLGEIDHELELQIDNRKISFQQSGKEVAYFSDQKLHVTDGEFNNSLTISNATSGVTFAFKPRDNGNLSFKKI